MPRDLDIGLVRAFLQVADSGSMSVAADSLSLTQSAISQRIHRLEEVLGQPLFRRTPRGVVTTTAGERLARDFRRMRDLNDAILARARDPSTPGSVRVGVPHDLANLFVRGALAAYRRTAPDAEIVMTCDSSVAIARMVDDGRLDLALIEEPESAARGEILIMDRLLWVGARNSLSVERRPLPVSFGSADCVFRPAMIESLDRAGIPWRIASESGSFDGTMSMVRADLAVTTALQSAVPTGTSVLDFRGGLPPLPLYAVSLTVNPAAARPGPNRREVARLADHIRDSFARRAGTGDLARSQVLDPGR